jgi:hypothetical protein
MSKKPPKAKRESESSDDVLLARVLHEQEWAHGRWLAHEPWIAMRQTAELPPERGGLGYSLSLQALKGLVEGYRARVGDLSATREQHLERELHDLDMLQREAARAILEQRQAPPVDAQGNIKPFAIDAVKLYADLGEKRRKLLGLDAATKIEADVVHRDAVTEELNAMLVRAGRDPIEVEQ